MLRRTPSPAPPTPGFELGPSTWASSIPKRLPNVPIAPAPSWCRCCKPLRSALSWRMTFGTPSPTLGTTAPRLSADALAATLFSPPTSLPTSLPIPPPPPRSTKMSGQLCHADILTFPFPRNRKPRSVASVAVLRWTQKVITARSATLVMAPLRTGTTRFGISSPDMHSSPPILHMSKKFPSWWLAMPSPRLAQPSPPVHDSRPDKPTVLDITVRSAYASRRLLALLSSLIQLNSDAHAEGT